MDDILGTYTDSEAAFLYSVENRLALETAEGFNKKDKKLVEKTEEYVRNGGTFVATYMAGMADKNEQKYRERIAHGILLWDSRIFRY